MYTKEFYVKYKKIKLFWIFSIKITNQRKLKNDVDKWINKNKNNYNIIDIKKVKTSDFVKYFVHYTKI